MKLLWRFVLIASVPVWAQVSPTINGLPSREFGQATLLNPPTSGAPNLIEGRELNHTLGNRICSVRRSDVCGRYQQPQGSGMAQPGQPHQGKPGRHGDRAARLFFEPSQGDRARACPRASRFLPAWPWIRPETSMFWITGITASCGIPTRSTRRPARFRLTWLSGKRLRAAGILPTRTIPSPATRRCRSVRAAHFCGRRSLSMHRETYGWPMREIIACCDFRSANWRQAQSSRSPIWCSGKPTSFRTARPTCGSTCQTNHIRVAPAPESGL